MSPQTNSATAAGTHHLAGRDGFHPVRNLPGGLLSLAIFATLSFCLPCSKGPHTVSLHLLPPSSPTPCSTSASSGRSGAPPLPPARETVVLIHGLSRTHRAMSRLARCLAAEGYAVINCDYPSRTADIQTLATGLFDGLTPLLSAAPKVHVVTHSMGGVLLRVYLQDHALPNLGRVVMLGPPSCGSEVVDRLGALAPFGWLNGPAGGQLGTDANSVPNRLKPPDFELGVIAGDRSVNPILSMLIPGRDDGKVSVTRTQTAGMRDFIRLHVTHPFMMRNTRVICQTAHFLKTGRFQKSTE